MSRLSALAGFVLPALLLSAASTTAQPQLVAEINPGAASATPRDLRVFNSQLFFTASRPDVGRELFHFDGQYAALASDIAGARAAGSDPATYVVHAGALYFVARNSLGFNGLWRFDGRLTELLFAGSDVSSLVSFNGRLYFVAEGPGGPRVWYWNGSDNYVVAGIPTSPYPARHLTVFQNQLYFSFNDGTGRELWRFDGQRAERATDVNPSDQERAPALDFLKLRVYQGRLYFTAPDRSFYRFNGTQATRVLGRSTPSEWVGSHGGLVFFRTSRQATLSSAPDTLWAFDGTQPRPLLPLFAAGRAEVGYEVGYDRQAFVPFRGALYYRGPYHLWRFTGTYFERLSNAWVRGDSTIGGTMAPFRGRLYMAMPHLQEGNDELYGYDGTGTVFDRAPALSGVAFNASLLAAEAAALEAGIDLASITATAATVAAGGFEARLASANPSRGAVQVRLALPVAANVHATVHDVLGRTVATLANGPLPGGATTLTWEGADAVPGVYTVRIAAGGSLKTVSVVRAR